MNFPVLLASFLMFTVTVYCNAGTVLFNDEWITYDDGYSLKAVGCPDWSKKKDLNNRAMYAITFTCEEPNTPVFPDNMTGVKFYNANIDNIVIPPGNDVINFNHAEPIQFKVQSDGEDWVLDPVDKKPKEPIRKEEYLRLGLSIDPKDLPTNKSKTSVLTEELQVLDSESR